MLDFFGNIQQYINRARLERGLVLLYTRFDRWFSTFSIDESTKSSIYIGLTIGVCVVTFLVFFPGEPTADYETSTEEEALSAVKRKLYKKKKLAVSEGSKQKNNDKAVPGKEETSTEEPAQKSKSPVSSEILRRMEIFEEIKKDYERIQEYYSEHGVTKGKIGKYLQVRTKGAGRGAPKTHAFYFRRQFLIKIYE